MRNLTARDKALYESCTYCVKLRVEITDQTNFDYIDYSDLDGTDWVKSVRINVDADSPVNTLDLVLSQRSGGLSISPFVDELKYGSEQICVDRRVRIYASLGVESGLGADSFKLIFEGRIDDISASGKSNEISIHARDLCGDLQDIWIQDQIALGSNGLGGVFQDLITSAYADLYDNDVSPLNYAEPTVFDFVTNFIVPAGTYAPASVWSIMTDLAAQSGAKVKCRYSEITESFVVTVYSPNSNILDSQFSISSDCVICVNSIDLSKIDVRNYVVVEYQGGIVTASEGTSIQKYGLRYMRIVEGADSTIDTAAEAQLLADNALGALSSPGGNMAITTRFNCHLQEDDIVTVEGNNKFFTDDYVGAVKGYTHTINAKQQTTEIRFYGKASLGNRYWLGR